jgi:hypothetical protein
MRIITGIVFVLTASLATAQPPGRGGALQTDDAATFVAKMMAFDKNKDGKLTKDEITDERLLRLFDRADANKDGVVTREELTALFERENRNRTTAGNRGGPPDGSGGRGPGGPPGAGQVLPDRVQEELDLTAEQKKQVAELQKDVDGRLDRILTGDQKARLRGPRDRGPGGPPP